MKRAGISPASRSIRLCAGCSRICIASKSTAPSRVITISPSRAVRLREPPLRRVFEQRRHEPGDLVRARRRHRRGSHVVDAAVVAIETEKQRRDALGPLDLK